MSVGMGRGIRGPQPPDLTHLYVIVADLQDRITILENAAEFDRQQRIANNAEILRLQYRLSEAGGRP